MVQIAALLALLGATSRNSDTLDLDLAGASIGTVIEQIAERTGADLQASAKIAQDIVFVHVKGVEAAELKTRLAEAVAGVWVKKGPTETLTREAPQEAEIWKAHLALRRKLLDDGLRDIRVSVERPFDARTLAEGLRSLPSPESIQNDPTAARANYERTEALFAAGPLARLLHRLVLACDPNDLAAIGPFERAVFVVGPNARQRGLDRKRAEAALAAFAREQQAWIDEAGKVSFPQNTGGMVSDPRGQVRIPASLGQVRLEIARGEMTALFNANLLGERGQVLCQAMFKDPARKLLNGETVSHPWVSENPLIELSPESQEFLARIGTALSMAPAEPLGEHLRSMMAGVEANDPLAWVVGDGLLAYAKAKGANVVAAVPDLALSMAVFAFRNSPPRLEPFLRAIFDSGAMAQREGGGWIVLSPSDRVEAAIDFTPRKAVAELVRAVFAKGRLDTKDYARYAFASGRRNRGGFADWFLAMIDRSVLGPSDRTDWNALRLYGSLSETDQRSLEAGAALPFAGMNTGQRSIVERIVYSGPIRNELQNGGGVAQIGANAVEPTDAFPLGVPAATTLTARVRAIPTVVAYGRGSDGRTRPLRGLSVGTLAHIEALLRDDPQQMALYGVAQLAGYALGEEKMVALRVVVAPQVWKESAITIADYDLSATPVPWKQLPEPYPQQIAAAIDRAKGQREPPPTRSVPPPR